MTIDVATLPADITALGFIPMGVPMARRISDGRHVPYDPVGTDGADVAVGLVSAVIPLDGSGNDVHGAYLTHASIFEDRMHPAVPIDQAGKDALKHTSFVTA